METVSENRPTLEEENTVRNVMIHSSTRLEEMENTETYFESSLFIDESYVLQDYHIGRFSLSAYSLQTLSTDFDLTGQLVWTGAEILNEYLCEQEDRFVGASVLELGSGIGLTGLLCSHFCSEITMTDHNDVVLKVMERNAERQSSNHEASISGYNCTLECTKLEWGNERQIEAILDKHPEGFDFILGADVCYQQESMEALFSTVVTFLRRRQKKPGRFILGYVSRWKNMGRIVTATAAKHNLTVREAVRKSVDKGLHEGIIYEMVLVDS